MKFEVIKLPQDLSDVETVAQRSFGDTPDATVGDWFSFSEMEKAIIEKRGVCCKAVDDEGKIIGMVYAQQENPINAQEGLEKWMIVIVAVDPRVKGQGVGSRLLEVIEEQSTSHGANRVFVYTNKGDVQVIGFYKKNGYEDAGWVKDYQHGKHNSAAFLIKYLKEGLK